MAPALKATVISGRYKDQIVRITNISLNESGKQFAACFLKTGERANIPVTDLEIIQEKPEPESEVKHAKTSSMPFVSGSIGSRTMAQTKNMQKNKVELKKKSICQKCGAEYIPGHVSMCEDCAAEA
jgi:hypothetical protein